MTDATDLLPGFDERLDEHRGARIRILAARRGAAAAPVHGYGGAAWNFSELAPLLPGRRLLIPDLPGHGGSTPLPASASLAGFADALAADARAGPVDVFGHSLGGVVALRLAERRPELVRSLVLAAAAGISSSTRSAELMITLAGLVQPGRIAGRRAERIAGSPRLRRLVFGGFEVANPDLLTERAVHGFLHGTTAAHGRDRRGPGAHRATTHGAISTGFAARCSSSGAHATGRCRSRTASSTHAACARRFASSPTAATC